ncbi:hypothetical protein PHYBLDRAFT_71135 [Phycomyces blakesleeanus NRRL 1555(-)]|uniref:Uncharacterized protein n=1 Tax=Phycomyces blakesleeanus (strain ATCC 8743b / DSM 1359 / FGSC 10004 / NBRC 33097 / NRRL 1555) TaxID=763407 RepID=A0A163CXA9_PHYB8|nr:hypothetical protein PHYBLDRAFT_71135 [Phycomyces blakesleeanus NRRL 1555(-)]OAD66280.1 hypothetical protein PHYBLDRAFT_71135 [Phycomyces blakesleeanus NRRL 1555(-)]|eukprot:XP_018284320.1 hypothetical protein PHYBLDRAFT_71135 [Phycomyces blakesleeanus NRRL 1555(-)]
MFSFRKRLSERIDQNKWTKRFLLLVGIQLLFTIPNLIATAVMYNPYNYEYLNTPEGGDDKWYDTIAKRARIQYESIWFIIFEIWRFWLAVDGVLHGNSMTISVTFFSTAFAIVLGAMQIVECTKVIEYTRLSVVPQIIMTSLLCAVAVPTLYATYKMYRHSDWIKFHKLGPDVSLHVMYHWVQCFVLVIKGDMFFQAMALCLYFAVLAFSYERWYPFIIVLAPIVTIAFLYLGRRGTTIFLTIKCQTQFGKGLRDYVQMRGTKNKSFNSKQDTETRLDTEYILSGWNDVENNQEHNNTVISNNVNNNNIFESLRTGNTR